MDLSDDQVRQITEALLKGRKIEAIKLYREATGADLREAKEAIEELTDSLREKHPDKFPAAAAGKAGCGAMIVLSLGLLALAGVVSSQVFL